MLSELPLTPVDYISLPPYTLLEEYRGGAHHAQIIYDIESAAIYAWNRMNSSADCLMLTDARGQLILGRLDRLYVVTEEMFIVTRHVLPDQLAESVDEWEMMVRQVRVSAEFLKEQGAWPL